MQDCYVDTLSDARTVAADQLVFRLNTFELDRESFKLEQERALGLITAERLSDDYLKELVFAPMEAAVALAQSDLEAATAELTQIQEEEKIGQATAVHVAQAQARLADRTINLRRAEIDRAQRTAEIASQKLRLKAEQDDLAERIELNEQIRAIHDYKARFAGTVELHTYAGAFVEKGDPICTLRR